MRLIDANALQDQYIAKMEEVVKSTTTPNISLEALSLLCGYTLIMDAPTIKTEPKHGRWVKWDGYDGTYKCSVCRSDWDVLEGTPQDNGMYYCPNCGAIMDESEAEK